MLQQLLNLVAEIDVEGLVRVGDSKARFVKGCLHFVLEQKSESLLVSPENDLDPFSMEASMSFG